MSDHFDTDRIDDVVLALLWANAFDDQGAHRAWKSLNWDALDRLHAKGLISNPHSHAHSVTLDDDACERGRMLFQQWFAAAPPQAAAPAAKAKAKTKAAGAAALHQFKITLDGIKPPVWRRIQLPSDASFWVRHGPHSPAADRAIRPCGWRRAGIPRLCFPKAVPETWPAAAVAAAFALDVRAQLRSSTAFHSATRAACAASSASTSPPTMTDSMRSPARMASTTF